MNDITSDVCQLSLKPLSHKDFPRLSGYCMKRKYIMQKIQYPDTLDLDSYSPAFNDFEYGFGRFTCSLDWFALEKTNIY